MNIALFFGGPSHEHDVSLSSASHILCALLEANHTVYPINVTKNNTWILLDNDEQARNAHASLPLHTTLQVSEKQYVWAMPAKGLWKNLSLPTKLNIDCAFIMMHGSYGEDGTIQAILRSACVPFTGSDARASFICMNKHITKRTLTDTNIPMTPYETVSKHTLTPFSTVIKFPVIVKPADGGSSIGVYVAHSDNELTHALRKCACYSDILMIEPLLHHIREIETVVMGLPKSPKSFEPGEILIPDKSVYTYEKKYHDKNEEITCVIPAEIPLNVQNTIKAYARTAYTIIGCSGFARIDFFLLPDNSIYFNEINTIPGCTHTSLFPKAVCKESVTLSDIVNEIIDYALQESC